MSKWCEVCSTELVIIDYSMDDEPIFHCWDCNISIDDEKELNDLGAYIIEYNDEDSEWEEESMRFNTYESASEFLLKEGWKAQVDDENSETFNKDGVFAVVYFDESF